MLRIPCTVKKCHRAFFRCLENGLPGLRMLAEFRPVPLLEFRPFLRVMAEPGTQFRAGRDIFQPRVQFERLFLDPARPEPLDEKASAIRRLGRFVSPFDLNHINKYYKSFLRTVKGGVGRGQRLCRIRFVPAGSVTTRLRDIRHTAS